MGVMAYEVCVDQRSGNDRREILRRADRLEDRLAESPQLGSLAQDTLV